MVITGNGSPRAETRSCEGIRIRHTPHAVRRLATSSMITEHDHRQGSHDSHGQLLYPGAILLMIASGCSSGADAELRNKALSFGKSCAKLSSLAKKCVQGRRACEAKEELRSHRVTQEPQKFKSWAPHPKACSLMGSPGTGRRSSPRRAGEANVPFFSTRLRLLEMLRRVGPRASAPIRAGQKNAPASFHRRDRCVGVIAAPASAGDTTSASRR